jgi:hypothetical protein
VSEGKGQHMKRYILLFTIVTFVTLSCDEDAEPGTTCSVQNPVEDLEWLAAAIQDLSESAMSEYLWVSKAKYRFMTVFIFGNCCPNCNSIFSVYNCSGEYIGFIGTGEGSVDPGILDKDVIVWTTEDSGCNFQ